MPIYPGKNNSKKISQLRPRDVITKHQDHTWIPVAQYDGRIDSYTNLAINLSAITSYTNEVSNAYSYYLIEQERELNSYLYKPSYWQNLIPVAEVPYSYDLSYETNIYEDLGYAISNSEIASNIVSYTFTYTNSNIGWQYFFGNSEKPEFDDTLYLYTELDEYVYTEDGEKIIIEP